MIVMGGIVGSGIFINPYVVALRVHTPFLILGVWLARRRTCPARRIHLGRARIPACRARVANTFTCVRLTILPSRSSTDGSFFW